MRALRFGDVFHHSYPPGAFAWIEKYEPVAQVGKTTRLYYIPESNGRMAAQFLRIRFKLEKSKWAENQEAVTLPWLAAHSIRIGSEVIVPC